MNKWTNIVRMMEIGMKNHLVSDSNCNTFYQLSPQKNYKEQQIILG